jgi:transposase
MDTSTKRPSPAPGERPPARPGETSPPTPAEAALSPEPEPEPPVTGALPKPAPEPESRPSPELDSVPEGSRRDDLSPRQMKEIVRLHKLKLGTRRIAPKVGVGRKVVRNLLAELGHLEPPASTSARPAIARASKLDPFRDLIQEKVKKNLTNARILREIKEQGYQGGLTILAKYTRTLRVQPRPTKKVWRRFETPPGEECQYDWSPYRVPICGTLRVVHAFAATLGFSRKTHVRFYPDEREATLLEAHVHAFEDFGGVTRRGVYDRMATVVLGTIGKDRKPLWHPRFLDFARYYGYEPYLCRVADPDRKGKDERVFLYLERDFLRGAEFDSFDDLNAKLRLWLDEVANRRVHGTTRKVPDEAFEQERPFLIALPDSRYPAYDEELRKVGPDAVISVRGTPYTIPAHLAHQTVCVHLYAEHFEVVGPKGQVDFSRRYVPDAERGRLVIDPMHYESVSRRGPLPGGSTSELEDALLTRFPGLDELCAGIRRRMKSLTHVHLRALWRLADRYGDEPFAKAAARAQAYRRFDAQAVRRILEHEHPLPDEEPEAPLTATARVLLTLGNVDGGSLDDYAHLDSDGVTTTTADESNNNDGENDGADDGEDATAKE